MVAAFPHPLPPPQDTPLHINPGSSEGGGAGVGGIRCPHSSRAVVGWRGDGMAWGGVGRGGVACGGGVAWRWWWHGAAAVVRHLLL